MASLAREPERHMGEGPVGKAPVPCHLADGDHAGRAAGAADVEVMISHRAHQGRQRQGAVIGRRCRHLARFRL